MTFGCFNSQRTGISTLMQLLSRWQAGGILFHSLLAAVFGPMPHPHSANRDAAPDECKNMRLRDLQDRAVRRAGPGEHGRGDRSLPGRSFRACEIARAALGSMLKAKP